MDKISTNGSMIEQLDLSGVPHSGFDMSHHNYLSGRLGALIPTNIQEVIPGDRLKGKTRIVTQFEPLAGPIMGTMIQKEETFYVPYSVIWDKAHRFFTGKKGFSDSMPFLSLDFIRTKLQNYLPDNDTWFDVLVVSSDSYTVSTLYDDLNQIADNIIYAEENISDYPFYDLLKPLKTICQKHMSILKDKYYNSTEDNWTDITDVKYNDDDRQVFAQAFGDVMNFWFGPSSMLDYAGVFCCDYTKHFIDVLKYSIDVEHPEYESFISNLTFSFSWLPLRAIYWCWYWNYRDKLIEVDALDPEEEMYSSSVSDAEIINCLLVRQRCWMKDSFTTALTNTGSGNVIVPTVLEDVTVADVDVNLENTQDGDSAAAAMQKTSAIVVGSVRYTLPSNYLINGGVDSSSTTSGLSLDMLDRARRLSSWLSKRLVLGTEYDDVVYSSFMVKLSNVRMHIPELLGAGRTTVNMDVVVNNTDIPNGQPAGSKTAIAWANNGNDAANINYYAEEHGLFISFMTVLPIQSYPEGMQRLWFKKDRFDFAWPEFAQIGMDAVYYSELSGMKGLDEPTMNTVFGYQGRYYDYKQRIDEEHGRFHTDLNYMTFGRVWDFLTGFGRADNVPKLNPEFVHCWPRTDMFVVDDGISDVFKSDVYFANAMERRLPVPSDVLR